jgi:hypothetical protein
MNNQQNRIKELEDALLSIASHATNVTHHKTCIENIVRSQFSKKEFVRRMNGAKPRSRNLEGVYKMLEILRTRYEADK